MRVEIDEQLEKQLDEIKRKHWITGKGHTETVRYLARHFHEFESIQALIEVKLSGMNDKIEKGVLAALRTVITNILKPSS